MLHVSLDWCSITVIKTSIKKVILYNTKIAIIILVSSLYVSLQQTKIPDAQKDLVITHVVGVHASVGEYSSMFLRKLRRVNYVTPKNYLDFIKTYARLLDEKDHYVLEQVSFYGY